MLKKEKVSKYQEKQKHSFAKTQHSKVHTTQYVSEHSTMKYTAWYKTWHSKIHSMVQNTAQ